MRIIAYALGACLFGGAVLAETPPPAPRESPTEVSPLTVSPMTKPPTVVASFPASGQAVAWGILVVTITFDQTMQGDTFDFSPAPGAETPDCLKTPRLLGDGKTFVLLCGTLPGKTYALSLNAKGTGGFSNQSGNRAQPTTLTFTTTSGDESIGSLADAMKAANLRAVDVPIQDAPGLQVKNGS